MAVDYLTRKGYIIIERNYHNRYGEIDIIAMSKDDEVVYIEVKYRSSDRYGKPLEAVNVYKQSKIIKVAYYHYNVCGFSGKRCRFDVIGIYNDSITHIINAFEI